MGLEMLARERVELPPELLHSDYAAALSRKPMQNLYEEITKINRTVEDKGYINREEERRVEYLLAGVGKKIEAGDWNLGNELVLLPGDRNEESGSEDSPLSEYPFGTRFTIEALLEELLINSDNTAYYMLIRNIHADELNQIVDDLGFDALFSDDGKVSAKEYSRMFRALYNASYLTREHSEMILEWLDESTFDDYLSHDLSKETRFPHKYGEKIDLRVYLDSGIVYLPNRPYLITVMVNGQPGELLDADRERAIQFMRGVSKKVYDYFTAD